MRNVVWVVAITFAVLTTLPACSQAEPPDGPVVLVSTSMGDIKIGLYEKKAPISVKNFLAYANEGFYDGTIFHRVIPGFMIQGGGFTEKMEQKEVKPPIKNEAENGISNEEGTVAMARTNVVDSATSQFFISVKNNPFLDHQSKAQFGYCVFGKVVEGLDIVHKIEGVQTGRRNMYSDVPLEPVVIKSVKLVSADNSADDKAEAQKQPE